MSGALRLLVVSPFLPHPMARHGGAVVLGSLLEALARKAEVSILSLVRPRDLGKGLVGRVRRIVEVPFRLQAERSRPARLLERARLARAWGIGGMPLLAAKFSSRALARALRREIDRDPPHAILLEYAQTAHLLPLLRGIPSVLTDYEGGEISASFEGRRERMRRADAIRWRRYLARYLPLASRVQVLCEEDERSLRDVLAASGDPMGIEVRPPTIPIPPAPADPAAAPPTIGFVGNFLHSPNREAARFLASEVLPRVRARVPGARVAVLGEALSPSVRDAASHDGVELRDPEMDLATFFRGARVLASPAFSGGGVRTKGLAALAHGVPLVTNARGARGLAGAPADAVAVSETVEEAARALAVHLLDPAGAGRAGRAGRRWMEERPTAAEVADRQLETISRLLPARR